MDSENKRTDLIQAEVAQVIPMDSGERVMIDMQVATAKRYPRSIKAFRDEALSIATLDQDVAASCFYVLPKGGKQIEGPSIRLAEIVAMAYKNLRFGSRFIGETEDRKSVINEGFCFDMENNVACAIQVTRRIVDKHGKRYEQSVIETTKMAGAAIARRNAIFNIVPGTFVQDIYEKAKQLAVGKAESLGKKRLRVIDRLIQAAGVSGYDLTQERILARVGKPSIDDVDLNDVTTLIGLGTAIKDGEIDVNAAFPTLTPVTDAPKTLADKVAEKASEAHQIKSDQIGLKSKELDALLPPETKNERSVGEEG
jgi:hypothetical protein